MVFCSYVFSHFAHRRNERCIKFKKLKISLVLIVLIEGLNPSSDQTDFSIIMDCRLAAWTELNIFFGDFTLDQQGWKCLNRVVLREFLQKVL